MSFDTWFKGLPQPQYPHRNEWAHYFKGSKEWLQRPELCLKYLSKYLPANINSILIIGCASGKDFIDFNGKLNLFGTDIAPESEISWVEKFKTLSYKCISVEDLTAEIERSNVDMKDVLVFSSGVLMYVNAEGQRAFYSACIKKGCKNFILQEYSTPTVKHADKSLHLGTYITDFIVKNYRLGRGTEQPSAHINLDISPETKARLFEEHVPENVQEPLRTKDHLLAVVNAVVFKVRKLFAR